MIRGPSRALTSLTGTFLAEGFLATTANFSTVQCRVGTLSSGSELLLHDFPEHVFFDVGRKYRVIKFDGRIFCPWAFTTSKVAMGLLRRHITRKRAGARLPRIARDQPGRAGISACYPVGTGVLGSGLISTSTPAERSNFISASSVCCVGSKMSSKRLCVRISNCSRDFLSMWTERSTQYLLIFVGSGIGPATLAPVRFAVSTISS